MRRLCTSFNQAYQWFSQLYERSWAEEGRCFLFMGQTHKHHCSRCVSAYMRHTSTLPLPEWRRRKQIVSERKEKRIDANEFKQSPSIVCFVDLFQNLPCVNTRENSCGRNKTSPRWPFLSSREGEKSNGEKKLRGVKERFPLQISNVCSSFHFKNKFTVKSTCLDWASDDHVSSPSVFSRIT